MEFSVRKIEKDDGSLINTDPGQDQVAHQKRPSCIEPYSLIAPFDAAGVNFFPSPSGIELANFCRRYRIDGDEIVVLAGHVAGQCLIKLRAC